MISAQYNQPVLIGDAASHALIVILKRMKSRRAPPTFNLLHRDQTYARIESYRDYFNSLRSSKGSKSTGQT